MVDEKEDGGKEDAMEIDNLIDFMERFEKCSDSKDDEDMQVDIRGHFVWKSKKRSTKEEGRSGENGDSDTEGDGEDYDLMSTQFDFNRVSFKEIAESGRKKLNSLKASKKGAPFKIQEKLPQEDYGYAPIDDYPILKEYIESLGKSFTSNYKKGLSKKEGTSLAVRFSMWKNKKDGEKNNEEKEEATFISLISFKNLLAKNRGKVLLDLDRKFKAMTMSGKQVVIDLDSFDVVVYGGKIFVINSTYFFYMFMPAKKLLEEIKRKKTDMEKSIQNVNHLIEYAAKNPMHTRELYYFVIKNSKIPDESTILNDLELMRKYNKNKVLFQFEENRIICTKDTAKLVLSYISDKLGLRFSDKEILNLESVTNI